ncbi:DnaJ-domain-containing protein [Wolfiporia cocos MD-104 SS10]|uniref:DnaJ-domain-containing protein n=1 Tax=Wolfiporia cocos (strain MD-104) TaxID=742152 RepID=A0A2H3K235_WOLCO|nr:DnaJ-domain-containing protein [Wolfiporia cocos MD-104 SS10]
MAATHTLYEILGIAESASPDAVRRAYKLKALETHPDKLALDATEIEREAAEARFRDVRTAFEVLSDSAKRYAYDNGLNYMRQHVDLREVQARLARERAEWARQAELRHQERMRALRAEMCASQQRYRETMAKTELEYQAKVQAVDEEFRRIQQRLCGAPDELTSRGEADPQPEGSAGAFDSLSDEVLKELRRLNPEWETRRQAALRKQAERMGNEGFTRMNA